MIAERPLELCGRALMSAREQRVTGAVALVSVVASFGALLVLLSTQSPPGPDGAAATTLRDATTNSGSLWAAVGLRALALAAIAFVCVRLLSLIARREPVRRFRVVLAVAGPLALIVSLVVSQWTLMEAANAFVDDTMSTNDRAEELLGQTGGQLALAATTVAAIVFAFGAGWVALALARIGVTTSFLGYFGVGAAVASGLIPIAGQGMIAGWMGSVGAVLLGFWQGGRGEVWNHGGPGSAGVVGQEDSR